MRFASVAAMQTALGIGRYDSGGASPIEKALRVARLSKSADAPVGPDTQQLNSVNGAYTPERQALHRQIINHFATGGKQDIVAKEQTAHERTNQRHSVFMMGGSGSGKSYYAKNKFMKHPFFSMVDADAIKEHLANADGMPGDHNVRPGHYHEESSDISKTMQGEMHKRNRSYVFDGTGANADSLAKKMKSAKAAGFQVHLHYAYVPKEAAIKRDMARSRSLIASGKGDILHQTHAQVRASFHAVKHLADRAVAFDNTGPDVYAPNPYRERREEIMRNKAQQSGA